MHQLQNRLSRRLKATVDAILLCITLPCALLLLSCGSNNTTTAASADYTLSATPSAISMAAGSSATLSILANASGSFSSSIAVAVTGLPAGVTATPASLTLTPGTGQNLSLKAAGSTIAGSGSVTLTGTAGTLVHATATALTITAPAPAPDFSLSVAPTTANIVAGNTLGTMVAVTATAANGFTGKVAVALTGLPAGVTATPSTLSLTPGQSKNISLAATTTAVASQGTVSFTGTSGSLVHTAALALTVQAAVPDFALSLTPASQSVAIGSGSTVALSSEAFNGFAGNVAVAVSGLPAGVTVQPASLTFATGGAPQNVTLTAAYTAAAGNSTITFTGTSGTLTHTAALALNVTTATVADVTTYHYDNTRQGQNNQESILNLTNVNSTTFGKTAFFTTDGIVDAQPLFAANVPLNASTTENLVYVASEHDTVYAFSPATGKSVWTKSVLGAGETTSDDHSCNQITPEIGITSTPVIDRAQGPRGAIYVVGMSKDSAGGYHHRLHALDLATGAELAGSPTEITATFPGHGASAVNGLVTFNPGQYAERAGLLLLNGTIYLAWTSHCDQQPYQGWIMGYNASTLQQTSVLNVTPNGGEGSIWMAGYGMAADAGGNIYFLDANGSFSGTVNATGFPTDVDYGNAIMKLSTTGGTLSVADFFQPSNTISESINDIDLGSGGAMLLPDVTDAAGAVHHLLVGAGKDTNIYVANRDNLGRYNSTSNANLYQTLNSALTHGAWSGPAYFNNTVYYGGQKDTLKAFPITNAQLAAAPSSVSATTFAYPGTTPSVSSNGVSDGIVWAVEDGTGSPGVLHAYDATNLAHELYNSKQAARSRDAFGLGGKFITPMVANGNVYVGSPTGVAVFGILPASQ